MQATWTCPDSDRRSVGVFGSGCGCQRQGDRDRRRSRPRSTDLATGRGSDRSRRRRTGARPRSRPCDRPRGWVNRKPSIAETNSTECTATVPPAVRGIGVGGPGVNRSVGYESRRHLACATRRPGPAHAVSGETKLPPPARDADGDSSRSSARRRRRRCQRDGQPRSDDLCSTTRDFARSGSASRRGGQRPCSMGASASRSLVSGAVPRTCGRRRASAISRRRFPRVGIAGRGDRVRNAMRFLARTFLCCCCHPAHPAVAAVWLCFQDSPSSCAAFN